VDYLVAFDQTDSDGVKMVVGDHVLYMGRKLFEVGSWPHKRGGKGYVATDADLDRMVENFHGYVPLKMDHKPQAIKDDALGGATRIYVDFDSKGKKIVRGDVAVADWLNKQLRPETCFSVEINDDTKTIEAIALLLDPEIKDAKLNLAAFAAFAAEKMHHTNEGQGILQYIHDHVASKGAVCQEVGSDGKPVEFHSQHELTALQEIHDLALTHGASCRAFSEGGAVSSAWFSQEEKELTPEEAAKANETGFLAALRSFFGVAQAPAPGTTPAPGVVTTVPGVVSMGNSGAVGATGTGPSESDKLREELAQERNLRVTEAATTFADTLFHNEIILEADKPGIIATYVQFGLDDIVNPAKIKFGANNAEGSRVEAYKATFAGRKKANTLTEELVSENDGGGYKVLFNQNEQTSGNGDNQRIPAPEGWGDKLAATTKTMFGHNGSGS
jgi:hypothetical protein